MGAFGGSRVSLPGGAERTLTLTLDAFEGVDATTGPRAGSGLGSAARTRSVGA
jgi:hypothetical protein